MSEQIVNKVAGVGRTITKSTTTIERNTPNLIAYEGRLYSAEQQINTINITLDLKLDESDYTAADVFAKVKTQDGHGTGLNADLLDGHHASDFIIGNSGNFVEYDIDPLSDINSMTTPGMFRIQNTNPNIPTGYDWGQILVLHGGADTIAQMIFDYTSSEVSIRSGNPGVVGGSGAWADWARVWTDKNHGIGSGLNADLLDGQHASHFAVHNHNHNTTYLGINDKAADSEKFDGKLSSYFLPATDNAVSATKLYNARTFTLTGDMNGTAWFDGTQNPVIHTTIRSGLIHPIVAVRFNGYPMSIYCSTGVQSVIRTAEGHYRIVFTTPFPDNKYVITGLAGGDGGHDWNNFLNVYDPSSQLAGECIVRSREVPNDDTRERDCNNIHVMITYIG